MLELRCPQTGDNILDVGCGLGHEVIRLAKMTGPSGRAVGVDKHVALIGEARRRAMQRSSRAEFKVGDAHQLEFAEHSFDVCRAERLLRYVETPDQVLHEMVRVLRPGGYVIIFDFDSDQTIIDFPNEKLARRVAEVLDGAVPHPWIGRQLVRRCIQAGLIEVEVVPHALLLRSPQLCVYRKLVGGTLGSAVECGALREDEVEMWWNTLEHADARGEFFTATYGFVVRARKP
jgi:ubiquinone/menaquinone biosynthesis C-methylase UbiE